ncbi:MAG: AgmX/PglI C-terminal domain-containing protein [Polyangiaceae bacterium]
MSRNKNLQYLLRLPLVVLPFFFACGSGSSKPAASADDANTATESSESAATGDGKDTSGADKTDMAKDASEGSASESSGDAKKAAADEGDGAAAPKDDSRTTAACAKVITDNRKAFKKCYAGRSDIKGEIVLQVKLDAGGKVTKAYIDEESTIKDEKIHTCIVDVAKGLTYPASTKGLEKDFEYNFGINNATK